VLKKQNWSSIVVTFSTAIFTVVSIISLFISVTSWHAQRETSRPYLTLKESPLVSLSQNKEIFFEFKFVNIGTNPASNLTSKTLVFDEHLIQKPIMIDEYNLVNDIPKNTVTSLLLNIENMEKGRKSYINPYYVLISLNYTDGILHKSYSQILYLKWSGLKDGRPQLFIHVKASEKENIVKYLKLNQLL
jgi:hypothetical protein